MLRRSGIALLAVISVLGSAHARVPPPQVSIIVKGVGFHCSPSAVESECIRSVCTIVADGVEFLVPGDLMYRGACGDRARPSPTTFVPAQDFGSLEDGAYVFRFRSEQCSERTITVRFPSEASPDRYRVFAVLTGWRVCVLASNDSYECAPYDPEPVTARAEDIRRLFGQ